MPVETAQFPAVLLQLGRCKRSGAAMHATLRLSLAVTLAVTVAAEEAGPVPVIPDPSSWNDTACHSPSEDGCTSCCEPELPSAGSRMLQAGSNPWAENRWTGNCTGCVPGAPCEPGNCPCGNCFPGVLPCVRLLPSPANACQWLVGAPR
jgi:hypothetical protein